MTPIIPERLRICRICEEELAESDGLCADCARVKRCMQAVEPGWCEYCGPVCRGGAAHNARAEAGDRFADDLPAPGGGSVPVFEDPQFATPRITEVPLPPSRAAELSARRVVAWAGLLVLLALAAGLIFGRWG